MTLLEGAHIRLRPPVAGDYRTIFTWYSDPDLVSPFDRYQTDTFEAFVRSVEASPNDPASLAPRFVIERRDAPGPIGAVGYYQGHPVLEYIDTWYLLADPSARGHGFGREAVGLLTDFIFHERQVERVGAVCDVENLPSSRLVEGLGFRREGTLAQALFHHGRWHDVYVYGVTRAAWSARGRPA